MDKKKPFDVMADLAKKYPRVKPLENESSQILSPEDQARLDAIGGSAVLKHLDQKRNALLRELEQLPKHRETYKKQELESILEVERRLQGFVDEFDQTAKNLAKDSSEYQELCEQHINQVMQYLDQQNFWVHKFTTENAGGASADQPLEYSDDDSVYYVTQSGISLRIKRSASNLGLGTVIQPFFEKIIFGLPNSDLKEGRPLIGGRVKEYRSDEFREILKGDRVSEDFESTNEIYTKNGKIFFVVSNDRNPHEGDRVNQIIETR
ncbi:MAG: hypothetical protein ABIH67_02385 [Candidatus Uhrbacteria bacterium]